jgi:LysM domain
VGQDGEVTLHPRRLFWILLALVGFVALPVLVLASPLAQEQVSGNLLADGDFEAPDPWVKQDAIEEVQVAPGWRAWYLDEPLAYVQEPNNCGKGTDGYHCYWMRPEFRTNVDFANRIHGGVRSQKYFSYGRMHEAGLLQQVQGIPPGARVRFSIWIQSWMCFDSARCGKTGEISDQPSDMHLRVGIDPLGDTDPMTTSIIWSAEQPAWDKWVQFQVETTAISDTVTVFTHSRAEWDWARSNNDVYLDDASLVIVGAYATPTATLPSRIRIPLRDRLEYKATPFPAGAVTHTVQMGDTLFGIALQHGVRITDVLQLNRITTSTELFVGQPLVVQIVPVTPTPLPSPTELATTAPTPVPTITAAPTAVVTAVLTSTPPAVVASPSPTLPIAAMALIVIGVVTASLGLGMRLTYSSEPPVARDHVKLSRRKK